MLCSFAENPERCAGLFDLLDSVFPGVRQGAQSVKRFGTSWESVSTPFIHFEGGRPVSHIGVLETPLILQGHLSTVATLDAIATHKDFRRRGHYRSLMEEALGFRRLQEHRFIVQLDSFLRQGHLRQMNLNSDSDVALLGHLLDYRAPVSHVVGAVDGRAVFCFNEYHRPMYYSDKLDVLICMERSNATLSIFDIVGAEIPTLAQLMTVMPGPVKEVVFNFSPDRLDADAIATPHIFDHDGPSFLMVRGPFAVEGRPFSIPRSARA